MLEKQLTFLNTKLYSTVTLTNGDGELLFRAYDPIGKVVERKYRWQSMAGSILWMVFVFFTIVGVFIKITSMALKFNNRFPRKRSLEGHSGVLSGVEHIIGFEID